MKTKYFILSLLASITLAQDYSSFAGNYFRNGSDARSIAMGNALSAGIDLNYPAYFNPAGVATASTRKVLFTHQLLSLDRRQSTVSFTTPLPPVGGLSVGWIGAGVNDIDGRDIEGRHTNVSSASENAFLISFGLAPHQKLRIGGTVKIMKNQLPNSTGNIDANGVGFDFGILYNFKNNINFALVVKDVESAYQWKNKITEELSKQYEDEFPLQVRSGIQYQIKSLILNGDIGAFIIDSDILDYDFRFGTEYTYENNYFIRAGLQNNQIAFGIGLKYAQYDKFTSLFDYAIVIEPASNLTHVISYAINF